MALIVLAFVAPALAVGLQVEATQPEDPGHPVAMVAMVDDEGRSIELELLGHLRKRGRNFSATWFYAAGCDVFTSAEACEARRSNLTYIASFPGSGNTWTRVLLQAATGIYTGSTCNDKKLRRAGLLGEGHVEAREVIAVKTHQRGSSVGSHGSALVVVRHPLHAALAESSRQCARGSHFAEIPYEELRGCFTKRRAHLMKEWNEHVNSWAGSLGHHLIVRFEDIVADTYGVYVRQILPFFDIDTSNEAVLQRLRLAIDYSNSQRATRRPHTYTFNFTDEDRSEAQRLAGEGMGRNSYGPIYIV